MISRKYAFSYFISLTHVAAAGWQLAGRLVVVAFALVPVPLPLLAEEKQCSGIGLYMGKQAFRPCVFVIVLQIIFKILDGLGQGLLMHTVLFLYHDLFGLGFKFIHGNPPLKISVTDYSAMQLHIR